MVKLGANKSPSLRGSGLKYLKGFGSHNRNTSLPLYEGVDWNYRPVTDTSGNRCLPLYEGVDWNLSSAMMSIRVSCLPLYEGVDWNVSCVLLMKLICRLPLYEGVDWNIRTHWKTGSPLVSLFTREWIEITGICCTWFSLLRLPLYEGVDWNSHSPRAMARSKSVSLFTREWIEIGYFFCNRSAKLVSLFTREWIEICKGRQRTGTFWRLPLYEGVDWNRKSKRLPERMTCVSLFTREWIEIKTHPAVTSMCCSLPLYEGVDWNRKAEFYGGKANSLPLYEGVDWNFDYCSVNASIMSPSLRGSGLKYTSAASLLRIA